MLGFAELFVGWLLLATWGALLHRRSEPPKGISAVTWTTGLLLGACVALGFYGLFQAMTPPVRTDPTEPIAAPAVTALYLARVGAHGVLGMGFLAMAGLTGRWALGRRG